MGKYIVVFFFLFISACQTVKSREAPDIETFQKQIDETNKKIDDIAHRLSVIQFMVDNHQKVISDFKWGKDNSIGEKEITMNDKDSGLFLKEKNIEENQKVKEIKLPKETKLPQEKTFSSEPDKLYNSAMSAFNGHKYKEALSLFKQFAENYQRHNLSENALYWTGECFYALKDYKGALSAFNSVMEKYPEGRKMADSLLKIGYSYLELNDNNNAKDYLKRVVKNYPFSSASSKAEEKLKHLQ
ncbi:MAG: tol-pal system protein YbgF [Desulfobacterales bacterium]|nr:tol-pal system protein YbgF [Desulfobacterales bacterium]